MIPIWAAATVPFVPPLVWFVLDKLAHIQRSYYPLFACAVATSASFVIAGYL